MSSAVRGTPAPSEQVDVLGPDRIAGITWGWTGVRGEWGGPEAEASLRALAATGATWVTLAYAMTQPDAHTPRIDPDSSVSEAEIRWAVERSRELGLKVCLKPTVNCVDGTWRAYIDFLHPDVPGEPTWGEWFDSYRAILIPAARLAAELGVELFCVGCEMVSSDIHEDEWRETIAAVREVYPGLVTYNCDKYQEDRLIWWDAVDVISSSGYYPSGTWPEHLARIEAVVAREGKPFLFLEGGCPSREGSPARPNDWSLPGEPSERAQAEYLIEALAAIESAPWCRGLMLWDWPARLYPAQDAATNADYCPYAKAGEQVLSRFYRAWARGSDAQ